MSTEHEWLNNLKPGDQVICRSTSIGSMDVVRTVSRVTATQIIVGSERYRKVNGRRVGDSSGWHSSWLKEATPEQVERIAHQKRHLELGRRLQDMRWTKLSLPLLEAVVAVLDEHEKESEATNA